MTIETGKDILQKVEILGEIMLMACILANMAGRNMYPERLTERKTRTKVVP